MVALWQPRGAGELHPCGTRGASPGFGNVFAGSQVPISVSLTQSLGGFACLQWQPCIYIPAEAPRTCCRWDELLQALLAGSASAPGRGTFVLPICSAAQRGWLLPIAGIQLSAVPDPAWLCCLGSWRSLPLFGNAQLLSCSWKGLFC